MGKVFESKTDKRLFFALFAIVGIIFLKKFVIIVINSSYDSHVKYFKFTDNKEEQKLNEKVLIEYIANCFGEASRKFEIEYFGNAAKARIRGYHGDYWYSWVRAYEIRTPFMDKPFEVWIDNRTHQIFGNNFYDVLSYDDKFQHLYSEWVKKQVGIDDENIEMKFSCGEIAFENVKSLSDDMHEILENADMACEDLRVYNIKELNYENSFSYAMKYKEIVADPVFVITGVPEGGTITWIHLYSEDEDSNEKYYFKFYSDNPDELVRSMY